MDARLVIRWGESHPLLDARFLDLHDRLYESGLIAEQWAEAEYAAFGLAIHALRARCGSEPAIGRLIDIAETAGYAAMHRSYQDGQAIQIVLHAAFGEEAHDA